MSALEWAVVTGLVAYQAVLVALITRYGRKRDLERATAAFTSAWWDGWWNEPALAHIVRGANYRADALPDSAVALVELLRARSSRRGFPPGGRGSSQLRKLGIEALDEVVLVPDLGLDADPGTEQDERPTRRATGQAHHDRHPAQCGMPGCGKDLTEDAVLEEVAPGLLTLVSQHTHDSSPSVGRFPVPAGPVVGAPGTGVPGADVPTVGGPGDTAGSVSASPSSTQSPVGGDTPPSLPTEARHTFAIECLRTGGCALPAGHRGRCRPMTGGAR